MALARPTLGRRKWNVSRKPENASRSRSACSVRRGHRRCRVRETCLRWGRAAQRLANLDALRALAHRYVTRCETEGEAATVAGLVAHLVSLGKDESDEQATLSRENAVTVGTLHSGKGLEWPITVLHAIDSSWEPSAFGVHVASDREHFDFSDPRGGRWIRYWPDPYRPLNARFNYTGKAALHASVRNGREHERSNGGATARPCGFYTSDGPARAIGRTDRTLGKGDR